jgi:hypothetical protein
LDAKDAKKDAKVAKKKEFFATFASSLCDLCVQKDAGAAESSL